MPDNTVKEKLMNIKDEKFLHLISNTDWKEILVDDMIKNWGEKEIDEFLEKSKQ